MRYARPVAIALSTAGFLIATYLTVAHYQAASVGCPLGGGIINCENVLTSPYSTIGPLPVSLFGAVWFVVLGLLLTIPSLAGAQTFLRLWTWIGAATVLYLLYTELFSVGSICAWCSSVHLIVLLLLAMEELGWLLPTPE